MGGGTIFAQGKGWKKLDIRKDEKIVQTPLSPLGKMLKDKNNIK